MDFEWDPLKNAKNKRRHGVSFTEATEAFFDNRRILLYDEKHSTAAERRYFLLGKVAGKVLTVRCTIRGGSIRIFGAGYWRKGKELYEQAHSQE